MAPPGKATLPRRSAVVRCIAILTVSLVILTGLTILIIWLAVRPHKLQYSIEQGSVTSFDLANDARLNANFYFVLRANNPRRKIPVYYDRISTMVLYGDHPLATGSAPPFYQRSRNVTDLGLNLVAHGTTVSPEVARGLRMEATTKGNLNLVVRMRAKIRLKVGPFRVHHKLRVVCRPVAVPVHSAGVFERVLCRIHIE